MKIPVGVSRAVGKFVLQTKKNSPHILFVGGVVAVGASTFMACKATLKLEPVLDEIKNDLENVNAKTELTDGADNSEDLRDRGYVYAKSAKALARLYGPAIVVGVVGVSALTGSHFTLTKRNTALGLSLVAHHRSFEEYRRRVAEVIGEDRELDIYNGTAKEEVEVDGKKKLVKVTSTSSVGEYRRFFDEANPNWKKDAEYNRIFLEAQERYFNDRLQAWGHVFLNEVFDALGFDRTPAGSVTGWIVKSEVGDGYISFGLQEDVNIRFEHGIERSALLDFNVDGPIFELI